MNDEEAFENGYDDPAFTPLDLAKVKIIDHYMNKFYLHFKTKDGDKGIMTTTGATYNEYNPRSLEWDEHVRAGILTLVYY